MPDWRVIPIRLGSLNTKNNQVRDFGRAIAMQNVDILKTNEITRRKGFIRRLEQQLAGPVRVLAPYGGICGRYPNYSDGGGTITAVGTNYWPPVQFTATKGASSVAMAWKYQDKSGARTTPGSGQSGVRIYRSTSDFIVNVDGTGATLVYSGTGTSFEDGSVPESGAVYYYSAHTIYSNYEGIVDQALIFAFAYALGTGSTVPTVPQIPLQEDSGDETQDAGIERYSEEDSIGNPGALAATRTSTQIALAWTYSDGTGSPPSGCTGMRVMSKTTGYPISPYDPDAELIYFGTGSAKSDTSVIATIDEYYRCWQVYPSSGYSSTPSSAYSAGWNVYDDFARQTVNGGSYTYTLSDTPTGSVTISSDQLRILTKKDKPGALGNYGNGIRLYTTRRATMTISVDIVNAQSEQADPVEFMECLEFVGADGAILSVIIYQDSGTGIWNFVLTDNFIDPSMGWTSDSTTVTSGSGTLVVSLGDRTCSATFGGKTLTVTATTADTGSTINLWFGGSQASAAGDHYIYLDNLAVY